MIFFLQQADLIQTTGKPFKESHKPDEPLNVTSGNSNKADLIQTTGTPFALSASANKLEDTPFALSASAIKLEDTPFALSASANKLEENAKTYALYQ